MEVLAELMVDPEIVAQSSNTSFQYQPLLVGDRNCYSEMWNGLWWLKTEEHLHMQHGDDACVLAVILHLDSTMLDVTGKHSATPVSITLGNLGMNIRVSTVLLPCLLTCCLCRIRIPANVASVTAQILD